MLDLDHAGRRYALCLGLDELGRAREVFISGAKSGSEMDALLSDIAIVISIGLQCGVDPAALPASMSHLGATGERASVVGAVCDALAREAALR
jgi:hypothetical protein